MEEFEVFELGLTVIDGHVSPILPTGIPMLFFGDLPPMAPQTLSTVACPVLRPTAAPAAAELGLAAMLRRVCCDWQFSPIIPGNH